MNNFSFYLLNKKLIFAEIGLNHLGSEAYARKYLKTLFKTSIDGITFQIKKDSFYENLKRSYNSKDNSFYQKLREKKFYIDLFKKKKFIVGYWSLLPVLVNRLGFCSTRNQDSFLEGWLMIQV